MLSSKRRTHHVTNDIKKKIEKLWYVPPWTQHVLSKKHDGIGLEEPRDHLHNSAIEQHSKRNSHIIFYKQKEEKEKKYSI